MLSKCFLFRQPQHGVVCDVSIPVLIFCAKNITQLSNAPRVVPVPLQQKKGIHGKCPDAFDLRKTNTTIETSKNANLTPLKHEA